MFSFSMNAPALATSTALLPRLISIAEAAEILGVCATTLRRWHRSGQLYPVSRTLGNHRRYELTQVLALAGRCSDAPEAKGFTVCYARVSSHDQKKDLQTQADILRQHCEAQGWQPVVITDLGSGLNYRKRGLKRLLTLLLSGQVGRLVLTYKDRLLRFGSELIFGICQHLGVEVILLQSEPEQSREQALCADVIELMTVFSARLYGSRSHKNRRVVA